MPTQTSERWIADGDNMVKVFKEKGYKTDLQYAEDDIPNQLAQIENMITKGVKVLVIAVVIGIGSTMFSTLRNALSHLALPALVLGSYTMGIITRVTRSLAGL